MSRNSHAEVISGMPEAEICTGQLITGLHSDLKRKVVGIEGSLQQLFLKAQFEEVKRRESASC
jgi:hypothetical protein